MISSWKAVALRALLVATSSAWLAGCSDTGSVASIDAKAALEKASGPEGKAPVSPKAKAANEAAAKHPKLR